MKTLEILTENHVAWQDSCNDFLQSRLASTTRNAVENEGFSCHEINETSENHVISHRKR